MSEEDKIPIQSESKSVFCNNNIGDKKDYLSSDKIIPNTVEKAGYIIDSIITDDVEENVRKQLSQVAGRDLTKREACRHGCTFLCNICDH